MSAERAPTPEEVEAHAALALERSAHYRREPFETALPATRGILELLEPPAWVHVSRFLAGVLSRAPLAKGPGWEAERAILGALVADLDYAARAAGEPTGWAMDLRSSEERQRDLQAIARLETLRRHHRDLVAAQAAVIEAPLDMPPEPADVIGSPLPPEAAPRPETAPQGAGARRDRADVQPEADAPAPDPESRSWFA